MTMIVLKLMANRWLKWRKRLRLFKKGETVKKSEKLFKNCMRKIKSPFVIYADFKRILITEAGSR